MKKQDWIDARAACALLGIKPQTLYAYVSRERIRARADPEDGRLSLYARPDIETLVRKRRRPRARADVAQAAIRWGDPVLRTSISDVRDGTLWVRGQSIVACANQMTLEDMGGLLTCGPVLSCTATTSKIMGPTPFARAMTALASAAQGAAPMLDRPSQVIAADAGRMVATVADACLGQPGTGLIHNRFATVWALDPPACEVIRCALVLLSDHELNPSTFAVRVCASTGASLPAALLAGMATLSGPLHGGVAHRSRAAIEAAMAGQFDGFLAAQSGISAYAFGFGHPLYPDGDPRAAHLLRRLSRDCAVVQTVRDMSARLDLAPNIDSALAALVLHFGLPRDGAETLFAVARSTGWIAHAVEQAQNGTVIRPRATYAAESG